MACFYRNQKVTLERKTSNGSVTVIYDYANTVTIEEYRGGGCSFLMIQYRAKDGTNHTVRYNCNEILKFDLTVVTPKSPYAQTEIVDTQSNDENVDAKDNNTDDAFEEDPADENYSD